MRKRVYCEAKRWRGVEYNAQAQTHAGEEERLMDSQLVSEAAVRRPVKVERKLVVRLCVVGGAFLFFVCKIKIRFQVFFLLFFPYLHIYIYKKVYQGQSAPIGGSAKRVCRFHKQIHIYLFVCVCECTYICASSQIQRDPSRIRKSTK